MTPVRARARARRVRIGVADQVRKILGTRSARWALPRRMGWPGCGLL